MPPLVINESIAELIRRLRRGQRWLTQQHLAKLVGQQQVSDQLFCLGLVKWDQVEHLLRCSTYQGCIWGSDKECPEDAPVSCDACAAVVAGDFRE